MKHDDNEKKGGTSEANKLQSISEKPSSVSHPNHGHRERMRARFQKDGLASFQPHEVLELLLFYALPRVNTNPIAHALIHEFHTLAGVMDAQPEELKRIKGISDNAVVFLKMIPQFCQAYQLSKMEEHEALDSVQKLCAYAKVHFTGISEERALLICLDESLQLLRCETISVGTTQEVTLDVHQIVSCAIRIRSSHVVLTHNHPNASADFSDADLFSTNQLRKILNAIHIKLLDHIVVGKHGDTVSMRQIMHWTEA